MQEIRKIILNSLEFCLKTIDPQSLVQKNVRIKKNILEIGKIQYNLKEINDIYVIGGGKASKLMAQTISSILNSRIKKGIIIALKGTIFNNNIKNIEVWEGTHPIPSESNIQGTKKMMEIIQDLTSNDLVIGLISGGGSALINLPAHSIPLKDMQKFYDILLKHDLDIIKINTLRKHVSQIKGGQLAQLCFPTPMINLIISDVLNDPLEYIASGPTCPDTTTFADCMQIITKHRVKGIPSSIMQHFQKGLRKEIPETPKPGDKCFTTVKNIIVGNLKVACDSIQEFLTEKGVNASIIDYSLSGNVMHLASYIHDIAKRMLDKHKPFDPPGYLIFGGESTVEITCIPGTGGRNQELSLHVMNKFQDEDIEYVFCSIGTDGIDGNSTAAGALIDFQTPRDACKKGLQCLSFLQDHDSYNYFKKLNDGLIITGPTGTNVADVMVLYLE
ncbi:MAG: glycerate kinase type-2 family protein [Candidatus Helarchaeota archaeon]